MGRKSPRAKTKPKTTTAMPTPTCHSNGIFVYKAWSGLEDISCVYLGTETNCFLICLDWCRCIIVYRTKLINYLCLFLLKSWPGSSKRQIHTSGRTLMLIKSRGWGKWHTPSNVFKTFLKVYIERPTRFAFELRIQTRCLCNKMQERVQRN